MLNYRPYVLLSMLVPGKKNYQLHTNVGGLLFFFLAVPRATDLLTPAREGRTRGQGWLWLHAASKGK